MDIHEGVRYKLLAVDVDDTLLTPDQKVPLSARSSIAKAIEMGVHVTLASGRMFQSMKPYAELLKLTTPLISYNGALLKDPVTSEILFHSGVSKDLAKSILKFCLENGLTVNLYVDDQLYVQEINKDVEYYMEVNGVQACPTDLFNLIEALNSDKIITKLLVVTGKEQTEIWTPVFMEKYQRSLFVTRSKRFIEFLNLSANKGACLEILMNRLGLQRSEVMVMGDSYNDIGMFSSAGFSVGLGKVPRELKRVAKAVVDSDPETALAEALEQFLFVNTIKK